jgi:glucose dehydrogenase
MSFVRIADGWNRQEATPLVVDGVIYASVRGTAIAVDAKTGRERWRATGSGRQLTARPAAT